MGSTVSHEHESSNEVYDDMLPLTKGRTISIDFTGSPMSTTCSGRSPAISIFSDDSMQPTRSTQPMSARITVAGSDQVYEVPSIVCGTRVRKSCYFDGTVKAGVRGFTVYNHMLLPSAFEGAVPEYENLKTNVCIWDVAAERQVELAGPDALRLAELVTPRAMASMKVGDMRYAVVVDEKGMIQNDPVALRLAQDKFWFSIADGDFIQMCKGLAFGLKLDVTISEPDVSPLAIQGPKSSDVVQELFGEWVMDLKYFTFKETELNGIPILLARSGWSPELGYELFLKDSTRGVELWDLVMEVGQRHSIKPGVPNQIRRIEGGMLSVGADTNPHDTCYLSMGLPPKWMKMDKPEGFLGQKALEKVVEAGGPSSLIMGVEIAGDPITEPQIRAWEIRAGSKRVGAVTSCAFSPTFKANFAIATLDRDFAKADTEVVVETSDGPLPGFVRKLPFQPPSVRRASSIRDEMKA